MGVEPTYYEAFRDSSPERARVLEREAVCLSLSELMVWLRDETGASLSDLARQAGIGGTTLWEWEQGARVPQARTLIKFVQWLMRATGWPAPNDVRNAAMELLVDLMFKWTVYHHQHKWREDR